MSLVRWRDKVGWLEQSEQEVRKLSVERWAGATREEAVCSCYYVQVESKGLICFREVSRR